VQGHALSAVAAILKTSELPNRSFDTDEVQEPDETALSQRVISGVEMADGLASVVLAMKSPDIRVVSQAINLASILTQFPRVGRQLWEQGIIRNLMSFVSEHPDVGIRTIQGSLIVLSNLARPGNEGCLKEISSAGGLNIALHYLDDRDPGIRDQAASIVRYFTRDPRVYCQEIIHCDGMSLLASHLEADDMRIVSPIFPVPLFYNALVALVQITSVCADPEVIVGQLQRGLVRSCASLLVEKNPFVVRQSLRLLHAISTIEDARVQALLMQALGVESSASAPLLQTIINLLNSDAVVIVEATLALLTSLCGSFAPLLAEKLTSPTTVLTQTQNSSTIPQDSSLLADPSRGKIRRQICSRALPSPLLSIPHKFKEEAACLGVLYLLHALVSEGPEKGLVARRVVESPGGLIPVVRFLSTSSPNLRDAGLGVKMALRVFRELCIHADMTPELRMAVEFVSRGVTSEDEQSVAVAVEILEVCSLNNSCWAAIVDRSLQPLIELLLMDDEAAMSPEGAQLTMKTLHILQRVSALRSNAEAVVTQGGLFPILHILGSAEEFLTRGSTELVEEAMKTLGVILEHPTCVRQVVETGQVKALLTFVHLAVKGLVAPPLLAQAMSCLDNITTHTPACAGALASDRATMDVLIQRVEESDDGALNDHFRNVFYRVAAHAEGPDSDSLWDFIVHDGCARTVLMLMQTPPAGVAVVNRQRVQTRACECIANLCLASPDGDLAQQFLHAGVLHNLIDILADVPAAATPLSVICDMDEDARAALAAEALFIPQMVSLIDGKKSVLPCMHLLALAASASRESASALHKELKDNGLYATLLTSVTSATQGLDPNTKALKREDVDALTILVSVLYPADKSTSSAPPASEPPGVEILLTNSCPGVAVAARHLHGLPRTLAKSCMKRLSCSPRHARVLVQKRVIPFLLNMLVPGANRNGVQPDPEDLTQEARVLAFETLYNLAQRFPEQILQDDSLSGLVTILEQSIPQDGETETEYSPFRALALDLVAIISKGTVGVRKSLMGEPRLIPVLSRLMSYLASVEVPAVQQVEVNTGGSSYVEVKAASGAEEEDDGRAKEELQGDEASGQEVQAAAAVIMPERPEKVVEAVSVRFPLSGSDDSRSVSNILRILTELARIDEAREGIVRVPGLLSLLTAILRTEGDLEGEILLYAAMLSQQLSVCLVEMETELSDGILALAQSLLVAVKGFERAAEAASNEEDGNATAHPCINEATVYIAVTLNTLAASDVVCECLQEVRKDIRYAGRQKCHR